MFVGGVLGILNYFPKTEHETLDMRILESAAIAVAGASLFRTQRGRT